MVEIINGYSYPIRGILYLVRKNQLRRSSYLPIFFALIIDVIVLILIFNFAYTPQFNLINDKILTFFWRWLNHIINFIIIILEVFIVDQIVVNIFLAFFHEKAFDDTLKLKGYTYLLDQDDSNCITSCIRSIRIFQLIKILVAIVTLPLNFIPTVGTLSYYLLNGIFQGWDHQDRYFELKKIYSMGDQWKFIKSHFKNMCTFGAAAFFLESIPIIGNMFNISNAVGIALYDIHLEKKYGNSDNKVSYSGSEISSSSTPTYQSGPKKNEKSK
jgi:hypothetical protein